MAAITAKNFKRTLNDIVKGISSRRDKLQELIAFGMAHYEAQADTCYLNQVLNSCVGVQALRTNTMKNYIEAVANIKCQGKAGEYIFKKVKGEDATVDNKLLVGTKWWEFDNDGQVKVFDAVKSAKSLLNQINTAQKGETKSGNKIECTDMDSTIALKNALEAWLRVNTANKEGDDE